jgi:hypothetical protein
LQGRDYCWPKSYPDNDLGPLAAYGTPPAPYQAMIHRNLTLSFSLLLRAVAPAAVALIVFGGTAEAQRPVPQRGRAPSTQQSREQIVPPAFLPPAGMCRIWLNGVPPGQQPAPTDCASAVRNRPANARVLFGDESPRDKKGKSDKKKSSTTDELVDLITRRISR